MDVVILFVALGAMMYFLVFRPQQRQMREHKNLLSSLEVGDVVVTSGGIYGAIAEIEERVLWLEVAPEVELKVTKDSIAARIPDNDEADDDEEEFEAVESAEDET